MISSNTVNSYKIINKKFSKSAHSYAELADVQRRVAADLSSFAVKGGDFFNQHVLELGVGTGIFTEILLATHPGLLIDGVDISSAMLGEAQKNLSELNHRIKLIECDIHNFKTEMLYDALLSSCCLHWSDSLGELFANLADCLKPGGRLIFALMIDGTFSELDQSRASAGIVSSAPVRFPSLPEIERYLSSAGFHGGSSESREYLEFFPNFSLFAESLKKRGVSGRSTSFPGRRQLQQLASSYKELASISKLSIQERSGCKGDSSYLFARYNVGFFDFKL